MILHMGFYALQPDLPRQRRGTASGENAFAPAHPCPEQNNHPSKNRVWNFFPDSENRVGENLTFGQCSRREKSLVVTIIASDHPLWPNRDPIEEGGGINLYMFNYNNPVSFNDVIGLFPAMLQGTEGTDSSIINMTQVDRLGVQVEVNGENIDVGNVVVYAGIDVDVNKGMDNLMAFLRTTSGQPGLYRAGYPREISTNPYTGVAIALNFDTTNEEKLKEFCGCVDDETRTSPPTESTLPVAGWVQFLNGRIDNQMSVLQGGGHNNIWYGGYPYNTMFDFPGRLNFLSGVRYNFETALYCTSRIDPNGSWQDTNNFKKIFSYKWRASYEQTPRMRGGDRGQLQQQKHVYTWEKR
jgi:hypothetical protein